MKPGRKSKWETHVQPNLDRIVKLKRQGLTDEQISKIFGVAYSTFSEYITLYPELKEVLKNGKEALIEDLEDTLYKKALGLCKIKKSKTTYVRDIRTGKMIIDKQEDSEDTVPPDTGALAFALKNLSKDKWKDRRDIDITATDPIEKKAMDNFDSFSEQMKKTEDEHNG